MVFSIWKILVPLKITCSLGMVNRLKGGSSLRGWIISKRNIVFYYVSFPNRKFRKWQRTFCMLPMKLQMVVRVRHRLLCEEYREGQFWSNTWLRLRIFSCTPIWLVSCKRAKMEKGPPQIFNINKTFSVLFYKAESIPEIGTREFHWIGGQMAFIAGK